MKRALHACDLRNLFLEPQITQYATQDNVNTPYFRIDLGDLLYRIRAIRCLETKRSILCPVLVQTE